jgi:predicted NAD-dependent protein-ADP-ribosyltransferase YbiA (DUF1768 family)
MAELTPILFDNPEYQPQKINGLYEYVIQDHKQISGFFGAEGFFLSNAKKCLIPDQVSRECIYLYAENAYQASKFNEFSIRKLFLNIDFKTAIILANAYKQKQRKEWDSVKLYEMERVLRLKFQDVALRNRLISTGDRYLEETNHWKDTFWGVCDGIGENNLGKILMKIRSEYKCINFLN